MVPYYALTRFGRWDEMLSEPEPPAFSAVLRAVWHYARGLSFVAKNQIAAAEQELRRLIALTGDPSMKESLVLAEHRGGHRRAGAGGAGWRDRRGAW
jgi:hypothetical protein